MAGPREAFTISSASMETITPIPYDILKVPLPPVLPSARHQCCLPLFIRLGALSISSHICLHIARY